MPELVEPMYCSQQIVIPPKFPYILKRYCKAAIKTQPYDLLRWSFEYFRALSLRRPPPVKLRLEYPVYSTEGGLTRGCLKVLANQLSGMMEIPLLVVRAAWQGFCLDPVELRRVLCLCEVYLRADTVPFLHFIAVAGGLLTKSLTNTMILLCETLTREPDGGSANIPVNDFLTMYKFLAHVDASKDVRYLNGFREGHVPEPEEVEEEQEATIDVQSRSAESVDDFWELGDGEDLQKLTVINDSVARSARLSVRLNMPVVGDIERSPSVERARQIERENYMRDRRGRPMRDDELEAKLRQLSAPTVASKEQHTDEPAPQKTEERKKVVEEVTETVQIVVHDADDNVVPYQIHGSVVQNASVEDEAEDDAYGDVTMSDVLPKPEEDVAVSEKDKIATFVSILYQTREDRREDMTDTLDQIANIVDRYKSASYDLGMVAGRQMSTTSGEFIVHHIEREILDYIDEQIAVLPDPDLKKKKAKPEEVAMIRDLLEEFLDNNMDVIVPEVEELEEEEEPIPEVTVVYAVPGIGGPVEEDVVAHFVEYAGEVCGAQAGVLMPRNIRHFMCPPLEKFVEYNYEVDEDTNKPKKEEVPMGGVLTD